MRTLITFGSDLYERAMCKLRDSAQRYFDRIILYRPSDINPMFREANERVLSEPRGCGLWAWKPYFILRTLAQANEGDYVFYCDSQMRFIADPAPLFALCEQNGGVLLFHQRREGHRNRTWTKRDAFGLMGCDEPRYHEGDNLVAGTQVYQKTPLAMAFVCELLQWCCKWNVISDAPNVTGPNLPGFQDHRHDQSVLSLLAMRWGIEPVNDLTQYGVGGPCDRPGGQVLDLRRNIISRIRNPWVNR